MALRVMQFAATIPAGTKEAEPHTVALELDNWELELIDLEVPPGPAGLMGFAVFNNGVQWIPATPGAWLVWDDAHESWYMSDQPDASGWSVVGYNTGTYDHTVTIRMHVNPPTAAATATPPPTVTFVTTNPPKLEPVVLA